MKAYSEIYPFPLRFTKAFTKGTLKGLSITQAMGFASKESAEHWVAGVTKHSKRNGWDLESHTLEPFDPENSAHNLVGTTFYLPHTPEIVWTVLHYHRGNAWVCKESKHGTTCEFYGDEILKNSLNSSHAS